MRTMKKVIALSLVLAMALSMMATAAFKDQDAIDEDLTGDISLMVALNVFSEQGTGAGYFEPNRELTREEVAKLIYVLKNKGVDNGATSWTGMNIFKDIESGRWSEGYINYAASVGMMAGTGEGYFNPTAKMSAVEVAKLLLVLNGYKADVQGYLGTNWDINIIRDAEAAGIFANYDLPVRGSVTREWVARLMNNGINVTKVKYEDGQAMEMYNQNNQAITFKNQDLGLEEATGVLTATNDIKLDASPANNENGKNKLSTLDKTTNFEYDAPDALLGQEVVVLYKGTSLANADKVYGVSANKNVVVTETTVDAVKVDDVTGGTNVTVNGTTVKYATTDKIKYYVDYNETEKLVTEAGIGADFGKNDGRVLKLIDNNGDGKYDAAFVTGVAYSRVSYVNPASGTIRFTDANGFDTASKDDYAEINFIDTVSKNDVVKITKTYNTGKEVVNVQKLDVVTGAVTKMVGSTATIDGNEYKEIDTSMVVNDSGWNLEVGKTAKNYYVDGKYVVFSDAISTADNVPTNVAMLIAIGVSDKTDAFGNPDGTVNKVEVVLNDGTKAVYEYDDEVLDGSRPFSDFVKGGTSGTSTKIDSTFENKLFEYAIKDGKIALKELGSNAETVTVNDNNKFNASTDKLTHQSKTYLTNDESYFFVIKTTTSGGKEYSVVKASEVANSMKIGGINMVTTESGFDYVVAAVLTGTVDDDTLTTAIAANSYSHELDEDGDDIYKIVVTKLDGTEVTLTATSNFDDVKGKFVTYKIDSEGMAKVTAKETTTATPTGLGYTADAVTHVEGNAVMLDTNGYKVLADDVKIYYVDAYKSNGDERIIVSEGDGIVTAADVGTSSVQYADNVLYKTNDDGEISEIIVEIHGEAIWTNGVL